MRATFHFLTRRTGIPLQIALAVLLALVLPVLTVGQEKKDEDEKPKLPDPKDVSFETRDRVVIKGTYFEPLEPSKSTVPIILLHGWEGNRRDYDALGRYLQERLHHAVLSIDLRGHGGSTRQRVPAAAQDMVIDRKRMNANDFRAMGLDVLAAKKFLVGKHKEGKLNIEMLALVGADMGAIVALNYAAYDWSRPRVAARIFKSGQDVKALVLLSPPRSFKGMTYDAALAQPIVRGRLSTMIIVGENDRDASNDAKRLYKSLENNHVRMPRDITDDAAKTAWKEENKDLFLMPLDTALQGTDLFKGQSKAQQMIAKFIELRLTNKADDIPWFERKSR